MSDVSLAFNAVGRDRGVNALLARTSANVRSSNLAAAASTLALGGAMASAGAHAVALAGSAVSAAGAIGLVPAALASVAATVGAARAVTFGLGAAWKATGQAAVGGGGAAAGAGRKVASNAREVRAATMALADAQRDAEDAQHGVTRARAEEAERLQDLSRSAANARLDEEAATIALDKAKQDLAVAKAGGTNQDILEADLAYRQAEAAVADVKDRVEDLGKEQADGAKKGVEGSDAVQDALRRQQDAQRQVQQAAERLTEAQNQAGEAAAGAASGGFDPAAAALAKLSPNGRAVILMLRRLAPAWQDAGRAGQQATFAGVAGDLQRMSGVYLPTTERWLVRMGGAFNVAIRQSMGLATAKGFVRDVGILLDSTALSTEKVSRAVRPVLNGFMQWVAVGAGFLPGLAGSTLTIAQRFERWSIEMRKSGQAATWIRTGVTTLRQFASVAGDVVMSVVAIFRAGEGGGNTLDTLVRGAAAMRAWLESAQGQAAVAQTMATLRGILSGVADILPVLAGNGAAFNDTLNLTGTVVSFAAGHLDTLAKLLPVIAGFYVVSKIAQTGANVAAVASIPIKIAEVAATWGMRSAMQAQTAALIANTAASRGAAAATAVDTAAQTGGVLARTRAVVATVAHRTATIAATIATRAAAAGQWLLNAAMAANPLGLIIIAIIAVGVALYLLWTKSTTFRRIVTASFAAVWGVIKTGWAWVKKNWPLLLAILTGPIGIAVLVITRNWGKIMSGARAAKDWIVDRFTSLTTWFGSLPGRMGKALSTVAKFITAPFRAAFNGIARLWNGTVGGLSFSIPGWVPNIGGASFALPRVPYLAKGGIVPATPGGRMIVAGEAGEDEAVIPLSKLAGTTAAAGGGAIRVWLDTSGAESEFRRMLRKWIRVDNLLEGA